jgi:hypothetical protein
MCLFIMAVGNVAIDPPLLIILLFVEVVFTVYVVSELVECFDTYVLNILLMFTYFKL